MAVASLVLVGLRGIQHSWQQHLGPRGYTVKTTGVFCHNSPQVRFTDNAGQIQQCELADLLVVVDHHVGGAAIDRRASLVQAKIAAANGDVPGAATADQLELLMFWHSFAMPNAYNPSARNFRQAAAPPQPSMSGSYGGIDLGKPNSIWMQVRPAPTMNTANGDSLGYFLAAMAMGELGYGREAVICPPPGPAQAPLQPEDWSSTIAEMLKLTASAPFSLVASVGSTRPQRGVTFYIRQVSGHLVAALRLTRAQWRDGGILEPPYAGIGDGERGVNSLHIEIHNEASG